MNSRPLDARLTGSKVIQIETRFRHSRSTGQKVMSWCQGVGTAHPTPAEARHELGLWTAWAGLALFLATFASRPFCDLWRSRASRWLLSRRSTLGLCFALTMAVHLVLILIVPFVLAEPGREDPSLVTLLGGGVGYAFIAAMALFSFDRSAAWISPRAWRRLHRVGAWVLWSIFLFTLAPAVANNVGYLLPTAGLLLAAALRILASRRGVHALASKTSFHEESTP